MLCENGYDVTIITQFNSTAFVQRDLELIKQLGINIRYNAAVDISGDRSPIATLYYKLRYRAALILKKFGIDSIYLLSHAPEKIYHVSLGVNADLYLAHVECGLYAGLRLIDKGKRVAFDFEDWYSEDYLVGTRPVSLLKKLEKKAVNKGIYITCPSAAMADALRQYAQHPVDIQPIYNSFPDEVTGPDNNLDKSFTSLLWFSQTVGAGRGLEKLVNSLHKVERKFKLTLVGNCSDEYKKSLMDIFPFSSGHDLQFFPLVKHHELYDLMQTHDIGLALENDKPGNKDKTISNKILQYLQSGMKVLATATTGQKEVAQTFPEVVRVVPADEYQQWGVVLDELAILKADKKNVIGRYNQAFGWRAQEQKLLTLVANAVAR